MRQSLGGMGASQGRMGVLLKGRYRSALSHWLNGGTSGKTAYLAGDSTTSNFTTLFNEFTVFSTKPGELFAGATMLNRGNNGASLATFLDDSAPYGITDLISTAPQIVFFRYGINDVRTGATTQAQLTARYIDAINRIRVALPTTDILFVIPNSLLSTDPTSSGYVTTTGIFSGMTLAQAAQAATDIMWNAGQAMIGRWPNVVVIDTQTAIYGRVCQPTSALMLDILHPINTNAHAQLVAAFYAATAGYRAPFDPTASAAAWLANPSAPWSVYARAVEDPLHMAQVATGRWSAQTVNSFIDFAYLPASDTHKLDILEQAYGLGVWQIPNSGVTITTNGSNTRILLPSGYPTYAQTGGTVSVWRPLP